MRQKVKLRACPCSDSESGTTSEATKLSNSRGRTITHTHMHTCRQAHEEAPVLCKILSSCDGSICKVNSSSGRGWGGGRIVITNSTVITCA